MHMRFGVHLFGDGDYDGAMAHFGMCSRATPGAAAETLPVARADCAHGPRRALLPRHDRLTRLQYCKSCAWALQRRELCCFLP